MTVAAPDGAQVAVGDEPGPLPRVMEFGIAGLVMVVASGVYLAAQAARHPSLVPPIVLLAVATVTVAAAAVQLARVERFAWPRFRTVFGWALLEYAVIAGMLVFIFVHDHTPGGTLALFIVALGIFALDIPMMFAFSVARFQPVPPTTASNVQS